MPFILFHVVVYFYITWYFNFKPQIFSFKTLENLGAGFPNQSFIKFSRIIFDQLSINYWSSKYKLVDWFSPVKIVKWMKEFRIDKILTCETMSLIVKYEDQGCLVFEKW